jgi:tRNA A58 N-methylase Trm61
MNGKHARSLLVGVLAVLVVLAPVGAGCGGGEPAYCSEASDLEQSVRNLGDVDVVAGGTDAVRKSLKAVETNAKSTVDAAKSDFPRETRAISESISSLKSSAQRLAGSPTPEQAGRVVRDVKAVVSSVDSFADATKTECD